MKNRESISHWQKGHPLKEFSPLKENKQVDVCIIGAGIAGLTAAYLLSQSSKGVIVLDDGPIAGGQTIRTTAHLSTALDDRYFNLERYFGQKGAKLAAKSHQAAIDFIKEVIQKHTIACDFEESKAYLFVPPGESPVLLEKELKAAHRAGLKEVYLLQRSPIQSYDTGPTLCFPHQAEFSPLPYLEKLCDCIEERRGEIYCHTHATNIEKQSDHYRIQTDQNRFVQAKHVIVATNAYIDSRLFPHTKLAPYRTYVFGAEVPHNYVAKGLYYDTADPYHYIRTVKLNKNSDMLLIGGEDHRTAEQIGPISQIYAKLEQWARLRFPMMGKIHYRWSGQVLEPIDSLAYIGRVKKNEEKYIITGDSGNGLTHGTLGALLIHDQIMAKANPWEELYNPHRISFKNAPCFIEENGNALWQYRDWVSPADYSTIEAIQPNCGGIVRKGITKHACYRDEKGKICELSAICPHLGALLRWNEAEHCWECPAHGSRFSAEGKVLQGPANCDLGLS